MMCCNKMEVAGNTDIEIAGISEVAVGSADLELG